MTDLELIIKIKAMVDDGWSYHQAAGRNGLSYKRAQDLKKRNPDFKVWVTNTESLRVRNKLRSLGIYKKEGAE
jgi:hypothetical protein